MEIWYYFFSVPQFHYISIRVAKIVGTWDFYFWWQHLLFLIYLSELSFSFSFSLGESSLKLVSFVYLVKESALSFTDLLSCRLSLYCIHFCSNLGCFLLPANFRRPLFFLFLFSVRCVAGSFEAVLFLALHVPLGTAFAAPTHRAMLSVHFHLSRGIF